MVDYNLSLKIIQNLNTQIRNNISILNYKIKYKEYLSLTRNQFLFKLIFMYKFN